MGCQGPLALCAPFAVWEARKSLWGDKPPLGFATSPWQKSSTIWTRCYSMHINTPHPKWSFGVWWRHMLNSPKFPAIPLSWEITNGGIRPKFSEKIGGKSFLENWAFSGQIGPFSGPIGAFLQPIGTNSSAPHSYGGRAEIAPKGPFLAQLAPFGPSPRLLSPRLDFPDW